MWEMPKKGFAIEIFALGQERHQAHPIYLPVLRKVDSDSFANRGKIINAGNGFWTFFPGWDFSWPTNDNRFSDPVFIRVAFSYTFTLADC